MKKIVLIVTLLLASISGFSQDAAKAKALLDEVSEKVTSYDNIVIDFKNVLENQEEDIKHETRGDVTLQGEKYLLNFLGFTRMYDGSKIYTIVPENEEITIASPEEVAEEEGAITPSELFNFYKDGYNYAWDILQNVSGRKIQYVKLTPIDSASDLNYLLLGVDVTTKHIYNLIKVGKDDVKTTLTVNSFKTNQPLSKSLFTFDKSKYDGYYINN